MSREGSRALAVVLASGGLDSCVTTAIAHRECAEIALLHLDYGQRTEARERKAFQDIAEHYGVRRRLIVGMEHLRLIGGSSLTDPSIPVSPMDLEAREIPSSYVPFRNANLLAVAVSWAEVIGAGRIYIGAVYEDATGYPDCRPEFYQAYERMIATGTRPETVISLHTPIIHLRKSDIVRRGVELSAPLALTWSCYQAEEKACGVCDSCGFRLRGFHEAGVLDPIPYADQKTLVRIRQSGAAQQ